MPLIKKLNLTPAQIQSLNKPNNTKPKLKLSPKQKFEIISRQHHIKFKTKLRKFHFKAIEHEENIFLFNGIGEQVNVFPNTYKGKVKCRIYALYELFFETPEENRQGGYKIDFCRID